MSRIPARSPAKPSSSASARPQSRTGAKTPVRPRTKSSTSRTSPQKPVVKDEPPVPSAPTMSIREAIALKRAEAKKAQAQAGGSGLDSLASLEDAIPDAPQHNQIEEDAFGRWSVRETIERGRSSGSVNLSSRSLTCIPSGLFEIHLNVTPAPLKSVPNEPPLPPADPVSEVKRGNRRGENPAWFEAQDLQTLKAWNNEIIEIQPEISMFGSLKVVDLHKNKLTSLPESFGDLTALTSLDLSYNDLISLPTNLFALPELTTLNLSYNKLTALSFDAPFTSGRKPETVNRGFFEPAIVRADSPLPRLMILDVSHNLVPADTIDLNIPKSLSKLDLSSNPLGPSATALIAKLVTLSGLRELRFEHADIGDEAFPSGLTSSTSFPRLRLLDLGETRATPEVVQAALSGMQKEISLDLTNDESPEGVVQVIVGKKVMREAWELELERRGKGLSAKKSDQRIEWGSADPSSRASKPVPAREVEKEAWEIEAERGMLTEGGKRRARAQAALAATTTSQSSQHPSASSVKKEKKEILKEPWEIEAEQGLLTEGGKRRARAAAAASIEGEKNDAASLGHGKPPSPSAKSVASLSNPQYYTEASHTLSLPASTAPSKASGHARAFSMATPSVSLLSSTSMDLAIPFASPENGSMLYTSSLST
uniref:Leucine-rich repeat-containing protein 40 n=1 Tax=Moniliophthora roreri TaxID=221103 RepID=A0A0W0FAR1_MONRR